MPTLPDPIRRKLKYLPNPGVAAQNLNTQACWNFALTGIGPNAVNPQWAFDYIAGEYETPEALFLNNHTLLQARTNQEANLPRNFEQTTLLPYSGR